MASTCVIDDCGNRHVARGWCSKHYQRWYKNGSPHVTQMIQGQPERRFWSKVDKSHGGCWIWTASTNPGGYGLFWVDPVICHVAAHRYSYELAGRTIPDGYEVDHLCQNPACVRPDHLEAVTPLENWRRSSAPSRRDALRSTCRRGHEWNVQNTRRYRGRRFCRACEWWRDYRDQVAADVLGRLRPALEGGDA